MKIVIVDCVPVELTMAFEKLFEGELRTTDVKEKGEMLCQSIPHFMFVDGKLAGEIYSMRMARLRIDEPDMPDIFNPLYTEDDTVYACSMAVLPQFQSKGLGKILKAYHMGVLKGMGYSRLIGHATCDAMMRINAGFGALFLKIHEDWYGTGRTAHFYEVDL